MLSFAVMLIYKFLDAHFGLKTLREKRLKISTAADLNDPFELIPYNLSSKTNRMAVQATRGQLLAQNGMLCFSMSWHNPVLWAHYSDKHRGICIGFKMPPEVEICKDVKYISKRFPFPKSLSIEDTEVGDRLLFTKYKSWEYEREVRIFLGLTDKEDGLYFREFDEILCPVVVIAGARCIILKEEIASALGSLRNRVRIIKARAGFRRFEIVTDKRGFK